MARRALTVRTLLHLPRLARPDGTVAANQVRAELRRNAERLRRDQESIESLIPKDRYPLTDLEFVRLGGSQAHQIFSTLHYLRSARAGSINFALVDPVRRVPVTLCSVSPLEWVRVGRQLQSQFDVPVGAAWDVSRVYSFDVAPVNAISYLLSKVRQAIRREIPGVQLLTTAVDPNLGFGGASYRSSNWQQWMSIKARPYLYVDGVYTSPRQLRTTFGGANLAELRRIHRERRFEQSRAALLDSLIFCCRLRGETEQVAADEYRLLRR
ncbi:Mom family adenine methylcarbamoylation protein [Kribbella sp. NPDC055071]